MTKTVFLLLLMGTIVSFWQVPKSIFDADQEYFTLSARSILQGDLTLIGQQTGIGELYHAPGFNYLVALGMWLSRGNPYTIAVIGALFSTLTIVSLYVLGSRITSQRAALFATIFALTSDQFLGLSSITQNVSPLTLITLLFLYVLTSQPACLAEDPLLAVQRRANRFQPFLLGLLLGLTLHFHILGVMLIIPLLVESFTTYRKKEKSGVTRVGTPPSARRESSSEDVGRGATSGRTPGGKAHLHFQFAWILPFLLMASPLLLFDIRNDWLIARHVVKFATAAPEIPTTLWYRIHSFLVSLAELVHVGFPASTWIIPAATIVVWGLWSRKIHRWIKITLLTPFFAFLLFRGHLVPYYAIVAWTPFVLIAGAFLSTLWEKSLFWRGMIVVYVGLLSLQTINQLQTWDPLRTIDKKLAAIRFIKNHSAGQTIHISRTMELATNFGFDYLLWYEGLSSSGNLNDPTYTLVVPAHLDGITPDIQFGDIGVMVPK